MVDSRDVVDDSNLKEIEMNALHKVANQHTKKGWKIVSINETILILSKTEGIASIWMLLGILGLLFAVIPGLIAFLIGYVSRGEAQLIFSVDEAEEWLTKEKARVAKAEDDSTNSFDILPLILLFVAIFVVIAMLGNC